MEIRLLLATPDRASLDLLQSVLRSALELTPLHVTTAHVATEAALLARVDETCDDVVVLDWPLAEAATPGLVRTLLAHNPQVRIVSLLPLSYRQYRLQVWEAGACSSIAKEHIDQEWLSSVLCIMHRAMEREARLRAELSQAAMTPAQAPEPASMSCCSEKPAARP